MILFDDSFDDETNWSEPRMMFNQLLSIELYGNIDVYVLANITSVYAQRKFQVLLFILLDSYHIHKTVFAVLFFYDLIQTINSSNKDETTTHNKNKLNIHQTTYTHDLGKSSKGHYFSNRHSSKLIDKFQHIRTNVVGNHKLVIAKNTSDVCWFFHRQWYIMQDNCISSVVLEEIQTTHALLTSSALYL
jgi:hypothetical protein